MRGTRARVWLLAAVALLAPAHASIAASGEPDAELEAALAAADPDAALQELSQRCYDAGDWERGAAVDSRILERVKAASGADHPDAIAARQNVALDFYRLGRFRAGEALLEENRNALERTADASPAALADTLGTLAEFLRAENRYADAEALFQRALALGPSDRATLLTNLAGLYRDTNRYAEALWRTSQALTLIEATPEVNGADLASAWNNMAEIYRFQGDLRQAESYYLKAVEMARKTLGPEHTRLATFLNQLAEVYREAGRGDEAERLYREALAMRIHLLGARHLDVASTQEGLGLLLESVGRRTEAEHALREALGIRREKLGAQHPDVGTTLIELAELVGGDRGHRKEARRLLDDALDILSRTPAGARLRADAFARRATDRERDHDRLGAMADLAQAIAIVEQLRPEAGGGEQTRARFAASHADDYARMVGWLLDMQAISEAFRCAERGRARALLDQLEAGHVDLRSGLGADERSAFAAKEATLLADLAEARARLSASERSLPPNDPRIRAALDAVAARETAFARLYEDEKNASRIWRETGAGSAAVRLRIPDVQARLLHDHELLVTYVLGAERSFALVVPAGARRPEAFPLTIPKAIAQQFRVPAGPLTRTLLRRILAPESLDPAAPEGMLARLAAPPLGGRPRAALAASLHALWQVLVPPALWSRIKKCDEIVVLPDDLLYRLPFEALVVDDAASGPRYWLDAGPVIRYGASALALLRLAERKSPGQADLTLASVADPVFEATDATAALAGGLALGALPGTAREAARIRAAFEPNETLLLQQGAATESAARSALPRARYVHIATHGLVDETRGELFATLALTPGPPGSTLDDGLLQLYEIYDLPLDAELAVISACESRVGRVVAGEGVFALSRAFLAAGARRVVASLWPAEDESTADLMASLFTGIAQTEGGGAPDYARALARAKKAIRAHAASADPFFWAPFVIEGPR